MSRRCSIRRDGPGSRRSVGRFSFGSSIVSAAFYCRPSKESGFSLPLAIRFPAAEREAGGPALRSRRRGIRYSMIRYIAGRLSAATAPFAHPGSSVPDRPRCSRSGSESICTLGESVRSSAAERTDRSDALSPRARRSIEPPEFVHVNAVSPEIDRAPRPAILSPFDPARASRDRFREGASIAERKLPPTFG